MGCLFEMHYHTSEVSPCGHVAAADGVRLFHEAGYGGIVVTDHYTSGIFQSMPEELVWKERLDRYLSGWRAARRTGEAFGMTILLGLELRFVGSDNDYLVYGVTPALLEAHPELYAMTPAAFSDFARDNGLWWAQAHPFRPGLTRCPAQYLDGLEVFNGNRRHNSHNDLAAAFAVESGLAAIAGSDYHELEDLSGTGVRFASEVRDNASLIAALRSGHFEAVRGTMG